MNVEQGPGRFYHTLTHLDELFDKLEKYKSLCQQPAR
jgi:predicted metal-dependent HD superfamily phosphohydrolase